MPSYCDSIQLSMVNWKIRNKNAPQLFSLVLDTFPCKPTFWCLIFSGESINCQLCVHNSVSITLSSNRQSLRKLGLRNVSGFHASTTVTDSLWHINFKMIISIFLGTILSALYRPSRVKKSLGNPGRVQRELFHFCYFPPKFHVGKENIYIKRVFFLQNLPSTKNDPKSGKISNFFTFEVSFCQFFERYRKLDCWKRLTRQKLVVQ